MEQVLKRLNPWWERKYEIEAIRRESYIDELRKNLKNDLIIFLTGMRRIGKTTLIKYFISQLQNDIDPKKILFVSLDHPLFIDKTITDIVENFREINKISFNEKVYLFFDEIQSKEDFEVHLKSMVDNEKVKIFCTGSQSLLMKDKKARLTGRTATIHVNPLSFKEFLKFSNIKISDVDKHLYKKYFEEYLEIGGIPRYVIERDPSYVIDLVDSIIMKDIVSYHNIKNSKMIKEIFLLLCERAGKRLSLNKISKILSVNVESVRQYISFLEESFLIYTLYREAKTLNERIKSNRKVYIADIGIRNVISGFKDKGSVFENLVFLTIKDRQPRYYFEDNKEIDFVFKNTAIECKFKDKIDEKETEAIDKSRYKNKIIVKDYEFFLGSDQQRNIHSPGKAYNNFIDQ